MPASESRETTVGIARPARVSARERIRDAAEQIFATHGYEGASMRLIAEHAGVAQALLHYHFQNKDTLYEAVFERRSSAINDRRATLLDALFSRKKQPLLEDVLDILFLPVSPLSGKAKSDYEAFQQIVTAASVSSDHRSKELMTRYYDPIARRFVEAFQKAVPDLSEKSAIWSYLFALGARMQAQSRSNRAARLSKSRKTDGGAAVAAFLAAFVAAGIRTAAAHGLPHETTGKSSKPAHRTRMKLPAAGHA
jgi:AcrR family transcriptional regulator